LVVASEAALASIVVVPNRFWRKKYPIGLRQG
jgi:hypothetical protein